MGWTELKEKILKSEASQRMCDSVTDIYGDSYYGLWLFQILGLEVDEIKTFSEGIEDELFPQTATWSLPYWEKLTGITTDESLDVEVRRNNIMSKLQLVAPMNPYRIEAIIKQKTGLICDVNEDIENREFFVTIKGYTEMYNSVRNIIERIRPAHMNYTLTMADLEESTIDSYYGIYTIAHESVPIVFNE